MNIHICKECEDADIEDDNIKCLYGKESYPRICPKTVVKKEEIKK